MTDLLVFALIPDRAVRELAQIVVSEEGHRLHSFISTSEMLNALERGTRPDLVFVEPDADSICGRYGDLLRFVTEDQLCFLLRPVERQGSALATTFRRARFLTKPILRRDFQVVMDVASRSVKAGEVFGADGRSKEGNLLAIPPSGLHPRPELMIDDMGNNRYFLALSPAMLEIYRQVKLLRGIDTSVLILGESGTGKEIVAHLLHHHSHRSKQKFINVNCAALPMDLLESELFGHTKGAFTGAFSDRPGRFEQSDGGTILLDEIGEISASMQAKLLHVLQDGEFTRLGARQPTRVDVHILAATNISMEQAIAAKTFREDLYYRLNTFTINVPPLRERTEEIPFLVNEMIWRTPDSMKQAGFRHFSTELMNLIPHYNWPGNLRELRNFVTRTMIMQDEMAAIRELEIKIEKGAVNKRSAEIQATQQSFPMRSVVRDVRARTETRMIEEALLKSGWNRRNAARSLNISYRALLYKIQQYELSPRAQRLSG